MSPQALRVPSFTNVFLAAISAVVLSACGTAAPGLYMEQSSSATAGGPYPEDIIKRLTIKPIDAQLIETLKPAKVQTALPPTEQWVYRIGPQDVLRISVYGYRELAGSSAGSGGAAGATDALRTDTQTSQMIGRVVDERGFVYVPLVGDVKAAGLTISELRERLRVALAEFIKDPQIELDISGFRSQWVLMSGVGGGSTAAGTTQGVSQAVRGKIAITDVPLRLSDALAQAGATGPDAGLEDVVVTRGNDRMVVDMYRVLYEGDQSKNMLLKHGDLVTVPDRRARKVFVVGEVGGVDSGRARSLIMNLGKMSLTEAIMDAGGPNMMSAKLTEVYVMRDRGDGIPEIFQMDAKSPTAFVLADAFLLKPRDVVYVNPTSIAQVGRTLAQFFPTISGVNSIQLLQRQ